MTPQLGRPTDKSVDAELDQLTYSAYLLTLDPGLALSVVTAALDDSLDGPNGDTSLLARTVELSLEQLRREPSGGCDRESSAFEVVLYGDYKITNSNRILRFNEDIGSNPILALESGPRIAFVLHHVLSYQTEEAAALAQVSAKQYQANLRRAYVELASAQLSPQFVTGLPLEGCAQA